MDYLLLQTGDHCPQCDGLVWHYDEDTLTCKSGHRHSLTDPPPKYRWPWHEVLRDSGIAASGAAVAVAAHLIHVF